MNTIIRVHGYNYYGRKTRCSFKFSETGKLLNPSNVAKSSMYGWGKWQQSEKVKCKFGHCWWVSTPGHGGYILITQQLLGWSYPVGRVETANLQAYVYEFEEDCAWAMLAYMDSNIFEHCIHPNTSRQAVTEGMFLCLREYFPKFLETNGYEWQPQHQKGMEE